MSSYERQRVDRSGRGVERVTELQGGLPSRHQPPTGSRRRWSAQLDDEQPTSVEKRRPPISAWGWAGSSGEPSTVTIEVANGIATERKCALNWRNASMLAIADGATGRPREDSKKSGG